MAGITICQHNKFGFCKHGDKCRQEHVEEICLSVECSVIECRKRHPKECRYFHQYKRCKFGDYCAFSHSDPIDPVLEEVKHVKASIIALEKEVKEKTDEIKTILRKIENVLNSLNLPCSVSSSCSNVTIPKAVSTSQSTLTIVTSNPTTTPANNHPSEDDIPQIDGLTDDHSNPLPCSLNLLVNRCENCNKNFESEEMLNNHIDKHGWGCDDCHICFTSKLAADLHEMEHHGDTPDSIGYIRDHVPESTKQLYTAGHRQR